MPRLTDATMEMKQLGGSNYSFSAKKMNELMASDFYTLGFIAIDVSSSMHGREADIERMLKLALHTCRQNPRADNMMLMVTMFSSRFPNGIEEVHGFKPLPDINDDDYTGIIKCGGMTPLYDAAYTDIKALAAYAKDLADHDYLVNGIGFVITDGENNDSSVGRQTVKDSITELLHSEVIESFRPILIGFNTSASQGLSSYLESFRDEAGFDQYIDMATATQKDLARLGNFISQSISSTSQSLGSGGPSQSLSF